MQFYYTELLKSVKKHNNWTHERLLKALSKKAECDCTKDTKECTRTVSDWLNGHKKMPAEYVTATFLIAIESNLI